MLTAEAKPSSRQMGHGNSATAIRYNALHFRFWVLISIWARRNNWVVCHSQLLSYLTCWSLKFFYIWSVVIFMWREKLTKLGMHADKIILKKNTEWRIQKKPIHVIICVILPLYVSVKCTNNNKKKIIQNRIHNKDLGVYVFSTDLRNKLVVLRKRRDPGVA